MTAIWVFVVWGFGIFGQLEVHSVSLMKNETECQQFRTAIVSSSKEARRLAPLFECRRLLR